MESPLILNYLKNMEFKNAKRLTDFHSVSALIFHRYSHILGEDNKVFKSEFVKYWERNIQIQNVLQELSSTMPQDFTPILLKGAALLEDIYPELGTRPMCDIDILIPANKAETCSKWLENTGFKEIPLVTWRGDSFKAIYSKNINGLEVVIEVHTRLLWHTDEILGEKTEPSAYLGFEKLGLEENLIYLMGHLGFQHNLTKLSWFFDIYFIIQLHKNSIDWNKVSQLSEKLELKSSFEIISWVLNKYFLNEVQIPAGLNLAPRIQKILTTEFLWMDIKPKYDYFLIKHLLKDSLWDAFKYDLFWGINKIKKKFLLK